MNMKNKILLTLVVILTLAFLSFSVQSSEAGQTPVSWDVQDNWSNYLDTSENIAVGENLSVSLDNHRGTFTSNFKEWDNKILPENLKVNSSIYNTSLFSVDFAGDRILSWELNGNNISKLSENSTSFNYPDDLGITENTNYAYAPKSTTMDIYDISNPGDIVQENTITIRDATDALEIEGNYLYYVTTDDNIAIYDISNRTSPQLVTSYSTGRDISDGRLEHMDVHEGVAYIIAYDGIFLSVDVSNPSSPNNLDVILDNGYLPIGLSVDVEGDYANVVTDTESGKENPNLSIVDISSPDNLQVIGNTTDFGNFDTALYNVVVKDNYAYACASNGHVFSINISDPTNPVVENYINANDWNVLQTITYQSGYLVTQGSENTSVINAKTPSSLSVVDSLSIEGDLFSIYGEDRTKRYANEGSSWSDETHAEIQSKIQVSDDGSTVKDETEWLDILSKSNLNISSLQEGKYSRIKVRMKKGSEPYFETFSLEGVEEESSEDSTENSSLTVKTNLPSDLKPEVEVIKQDGSEISAEVPSTGYVFENLVSDTHTVTISEEIGSYQFQEWKGDLSSTKNPVDIHLSDKEIKAVYSETGEAPVPIPDTDLSIIGTTGTISDGDFVPEDSFAGGEVVFVRAKVKANGNEILNAKVSGEWNGSSFDMSYNENYYLGSFRIPEDTSTGAYMVTETADINGESVKDSQTIHVESFLKPSRPDEFPNWFKYLALLSFFLFLAFLPDDRWDRTPRNWWDDSKEGSWTFSDDAIIIVILSLMASLVIFLFYGINFGSIFYSIMAVSSVIVVVTEMFNPDSSLASICFDGKREGTLILSGIFFSISFIYASSWLVELMSGNIWTYNIISFLTTNMPKGVAIISTAVMIPILEEALYRGVMVPTMSERTGIWVSIVFGAIIFGISHVLFGAGVSMLIISTLFGIVTGWILLRNQSLAFSIPAHITYNSIVSLIILGII